jgi:hypothetical protein
MPAIHGFGKQVFVARTAFRSDESISGRGPGPSQVPQNTRVKTQLTMLRFNGLVNRIGGPTDAGELVLV